MSTNVLALGIKIAVLLSVSREMPEPTGGGGMKQPARQRFTHISIFPFLLAAIDNPILGADFLAESDFLVDSARGQVIQHSLLKPLAIPLFSPTDSAIASIFKLTTDIASLLDKYPAAWNPCLPGQLPDHQIKHVIKMDQVKLAAAKEEFQTISKWFLNQMDHGILAGITTDEQCDQAW